MILVKQGSRVVLVYLVKEVLMDHLVIREKRYVKSVHVCVCVCVCVF